MTPAAPAPGRRDVPLWRWERLRGLEERLGEVVQCAARMELEELHGDLDDFGACAFGKQKAGKSAKIPARFWYIDTFEE